MIPRRAQRDLLRTLGRTCHALEVSWAGQDLAPVRITTGPLPHRRPSWQAQFGGSPDEAGAFGWGPQRCARDPLLAAVGIRRLRGWRTESGGQLMVGGGAGLEVSEHELELQAGALSALDAASSGGEALEHMGLAAAGVAHDLRNLLAVAQLEVEAVGLGGPATEVRLQSTLREARGVAEAFLAGGGVSRRRVTALGPILARAAKRAPEIAHLRLERRVTVHVDCPAETFVVGQPDQLARVFDNLLANAVAAAAVGAAEPEPVECRVQCSREEVLVEVRDHGPGLSDRDLARALTPGRSGTGGTGYGTSSVRHCLELLGGEFWIESEQGTGTTCLVTLRNALPPGTAVTLVVSPDPVLRIAWVSALRGHGLEGLGVRDATEALAWVEVLDVTGVLWARGTPGRGRAQLESHLLEHGRPLCELSVRGPAPRSPGQRGANNVLARMAGR